MRKCVSDHLYIASFIDPDIFAARALYSMVFLLKFIHPGDSVLMTPQHFSMTDLVIFPKLLLTRRTLDYQHKKLP
jgi:hypothetical protein